MSLCDLFKCSGASSCFGESLFNIDRPALQIGLTDTSLHSSQKYDLLTNSCNKRIRDSFVLLVGNLRAYPIVMNLVSCYRYFQYVLTESEVSVVNATEWWIVKIWSSKTPRSSFYPLVAHEPPISFTQLFADSFFGVPIFSRCFAYLIQCWN